MIYLVNTDHSSILNSFMNKNSKRKIENKKNSYMSNYSSQSSSNSSSKSSASQSPNSSPIRKNKCFEYRVVTTPSVHQSKSINSNSYYQTNKNRNSHAYQSKDAELPIFKLPRLT